VKTRTWCEWVTHGEGKGFGSLLWLYLHVVGHLKLLSVEHVGEVLSLLPLSAMTVHEEDREHVLEAG
jgi:hypothetical protein